MQAMPRICTDRGGGQGRAQRAGFAGHESLTAAGIGDWELCPQVTTLLGVPRWKLSMLSITWSQTVCIASALAQATCGVMITLGREAICQKG
jgi:hypothetical protein